MATTKINPNAFGVTFTLVIIILDIAGYVWHGLLKQPSIMNLLYPGFWTTSSLLLLGFVGSLFFAYIFGYLLAYIFNWANKKIK